MSVLEKRVVSSVLLSAVVLVSNREWSFWTQPESIVQAMAPRYRLVGSVHFTYFIIYRFSIAARTAAAGPR